MKFTHFLAAAFLLSATAGQAQNAAPKPLSPAKNTNTTARPKLIVGMVVDQMRWDYLYRYAGRYGAGGFKRLLQDGFSCENTLINYTPTITACGHTCVYTGSVPAIHGIIGNTWYSPELGRTMYCAEDTTVTTVGSSSAAGKMSPRNMLVTTIGDELKLSNNFQSKVIGVAIKDRGAILPAGHSANAAFWYDAGTGNWVSSTYYMNELPVWAQEFNQQKFPQQYLSKPWTTLYPVSTYTLSTADEKPYEGKYKNATNTSFPHNLSEIANTAISASPYGNTMTLEFAKKAMEAYGLGKGPVTDLLAISLSSPDYVGHQFGPNSIEAEDTYLRLDQDLAAFFTYLDAKVGKGQYLFFITADHGVAHVPGFMAENKLPGGAWDDKAAVASLNDQVAAKFGVKNVVKGADNYQFWLNHDAIEQAGKSEADIRQFMIRELLKSPAIAKAFSIDNLMGTTLPEPMRTMLSNGFNTKRSGDIQVVLTPGYIDGGNVGTTHGLWYPYDAHIPLVWMGWGVRPGKTNRTVGMTDITPTLAALLHIQMPSGNVGQVIQEITH
ncbi:Type I phosphodiesterase / nucleotide pyrophosphatase [Chitinophaga ginsengisegetis]|uniref:Type I phosphodiesterase / nucleotide pyrophosphatase n=1 Tax=Chitinophaga ginsengisegetis TaxID=393003 RepID=A0A1T5P187_9BACT|nr:alkaline phosphatase PafA [Chitinophaga ginsengisegetis]SKD06510.1 Type I phosphodiesterase / nucleotide pyrophosphatase [Chitinophaga ginsengisegetis]